MKEQLSALMDGELEMDTNPHLYTALKKGGEARECWSTYHLIGDALRGEMPVRAGLRSEIMRRLEDEPVILAPRRRLRDTFHSVFMVPMAASVAAVAFVGWMVWQSQGAGMQPELPQATIAKNTISPETLNNYMLAHHEYAPSNSMQHAYDIRPATYTEPNN